MDLLPWMLLSFGVLNLFFVRHSYGIKCYVCGPTEKGECDSQFQVECNPETMHPKLPEGSKVLCKTIKMQYGLDDFSISKECISENEFLSAYPNPATTCLQPFANKTICVCNHNFCNQKPIETQVDTMNRSYSVLHLLAAGLPMQVEGAKVPVDFSIDQPPNQIAAFNVNANIGYLTDIPHVQPDNNEPIRLVAPAVSVNLPPAASVAARTRQANSSAFLRGGLIIGGERGGSSASRSRLQLGANVGASPPTSFAPASLNSFNQTPPRFPNESPPSFVASNIHPDGGGSVHEDSGYLIPHSEPQPPSQLPPRINHPITESLSQSGSPNSPNPSQETLQSTFGDEIQSQTDPPQHSPPRGASIYPYPKSSQSNASIADNQPINVNPFDPIPGSLFAGAFQNPVATPTRSAASVGSTGNAPVLVGGNVIYPQPEVLISKVADVERTPGSGSGARIPGQAADQPVNIPIVIPDYDAPVQSLPSPLVNVDAAQPNAVPEPEPESEPEPSSEPETKSFVQDQQPLNHSSVIGEPEPVSDYSPEAGIHLEPEIAVEADYRPPDLVNQHTGEVWTEADTGGGLGTVSDLECAMCGEADLEDPAECTQQELRGCNPQNHPPGSQLRCLTRNTLLGDEKHAIEKFCISDVALHTDYGSLVGNRSEGCYITAGGWILFCICATSQCNHVTIGAQMEAYELIDLDAATSPEPGVESAEPEPVGAVAEPEPVMQGSNYCKMCAEVDLIDAVECREQFDMDCSLAYPPNTTMYCLTRLTKHPNGKYSMEKRCVSQSDHTQQYPGTPVVHDGCGQAWQGYVQYCVCQGDNCNDGTLFDDQAAQGFVPPELPESTTPAAGRPISYNGNSVQIETPAPEPSPSDDSLSVPEPESPAEPNLVQNDDIGAPESEHRNEAAESATPSSSSSGTTQSFEQFWKSVNGGGSVFRSTDLLHLLGVTLIALLLASFSSSCFR